MRIGCESWTSLEADDVAWVTEWLLSAAFGWVPIGEESPVSPDPAPYYTSQCWLVTVRAGDREIHAVLPLRDLAKVIRWCHGIEDVADLAQPPLWVRGSVEALRRAISHALHRVDPLRFMGYQPAAAA